MFKKTLAIIAPLLLIAVIIGSSQVEARGGGGGAGCVVRASGCQASVSFAPFNGTPTVVCPNWGTVFRVTFSISCGLTIGGGTTVSELVCSETDVPLNFVIDGQTHTFAPSAGRNWGNAQSSCESIVYSVN